MPQAYESRVVRLSIPSDSTLEILHYASSLLNEIYREGYGYKKAGVILSEISPNSGVQIQLFDEIDRDKHSKLMYAVDSINKSEGRNKVIIAAQGFEGVKLNRDYLSPSYNTTDWNDIITVKV